MPECHSDLIFRYLHRFIHHIGGMPDFTALKFTKYNQYESFALPLRKYLIDHGVQFQFSTTVTDVDFDITEKRRQATRIHWSVTDGENKVPGGVDLGPNDLLFMTIGSLTENSDNGDHHTPAKLNEGPAPAWDLWRHIAAKDLSGAFGHPNVFGAHIPETKWEAATVTTLDKRIPAYIQKICKRDPFSGKVVTGGIVTAKDSKWLMSWTVNRQPHFKKQPKDQIVVWVYSLFVDTPGDYVKKTMSECTGEEITQEWLYHMGVPVEEIPELAATGAKTVPTMMPYVTSFFMPREAGDRPDVIPEGSVNFAFIGQFAESKVSRLAGALTMDADDSLSRATASSPRSTLFARLWRARTTFSASNAVSPRCSTAHTMFALSLPQRHRCVMASLCTCPDQSLSTSSSSVLWRTMSLAASWLRRASSQTWPRRRRRSKLP